MFYRVTIETINNAIYKIDWLAKNEKIAKHEIYHYLQKNSFPEKITIIKAENMPDIGYYPSLTQIN